MEQYVGLDVSLKETEVCVLDVRGSELARGRVATAPEALAGWLLEHAPEAVVAVLETGGQSSWLCEGLEALGVPAVIVDARRAKKALSCRINQTDANDAEGLAQLARTGWYLRVAVKRPEVRRARALMRARQLLARQRRSIENQVRGFLRGFGLKVGQVTKPGFEARVEALLADEPGLAPVVRPLLEVRRAVLAELEVLEDGIGKVAKASPTCRRLMSVPGVGPMTALAFMTAIGDPERFERSRDVGAYLGLTPRRFKSGDMDYTGKISKWGDALARHMLYEAANSLLSRVRGWCGPKAWAARLVRKIGAKKARVALARKLAVILHRIWCDGTTFDWRAGQAA
jgi:transposase